VTLGEDQKEVIDAFAKYGFRALPVWMKRTISEE